MPDAGISREIDHLIDLLARLASGDLRARGVPTSRDDSIDAIIVGVNMLAEELEASRDELEDRVRARTEEYERLNLDISRLTELGNLLQACESVDEAYGVIGHSLGVMFSGLAGAMYLYRSSRNVLEIRASWGDLDALPVLGTTDCWALRRGQRHLVSAADPTLSCRHVQHRAGDSICILMSAHGEIIGLLHVTARGPVTTGVAAPLTPAKQSLGVAVGEQTALALANLELREKLRLQALRDPLTGLLNRRFVEEWIGREVAVTDHSGRSFGVIMADVDHFKQVNDLHGHDAGDEILKAVAEAIRGSMRIGDLPCRYGGEEFLVLIADIDLTTLRERADEVRERVARVRVEHRGTLLSAITMSVGIALYPQHGSSAALVVDAADAALYVAKRNGRDRLEVAPDPG